MAIKYCFLSLACYNLINLMAIKISRLACAFWFEWGIFCLLICCLCRRSIKLSIFYNHFPPFYLVFCVFLINMIAHMEKATCQYIFNMFSRVDSVTILRALCLYRAKRNCLTWINQRINEVWLFFVLPIPSFYLLEVCFPVRVKII